MNDSENQIDLFRLYRELYRILPGGNMQELMEVCYGIVGVPILAVDVAYNVLGIAPEAPQNDPMWDYLLENRGFETDQAARLYEEGVVQSVNVHEAPYIVDWGYNREYPKIQGIIKIDGVVEGYVTMNCTYEKITPSHMKAMDIIMHVCSFFYKRNTASDSIDSVYQNRFAKELFHNRIKTEQQLQTWFKNMKLQLKPPYLVTTVQTFNHKDPNVLAYIQKRIQQLFPQQLMLMDQNILYVLQYQVDRLRGSATAYEGIQKMVEKFHAQCGNSNQFEQLLDIAVYKKQAEDAMTIGGKRNPGEHIHYYHEYALQAILTSCIRNMPEENYVPQSLEKIQEYDRKNATEFLDTLHCYIRNLENTTDTAWELHIHRNTLLYRMKKIEELFNLSLNDYQTIFHFMLVFYIQEELPS